MKNRLQKALSLLLTIIMIFSVCVFTETTACAASATYYVKKYGSDNAAGTSKAPLATISKAIQKGVSAGLKAGDTLTVRVMDFPDVSWGETSNYDFNLKVVSDTSSRCNVYIPDNTHLTGNVSFSNAVVKAPTIFFNNKNVEFDSKCILDGINYYLGAENVSSTTAKGQTVYFNTALSDKIIYIADKNDIEKVYSGDLNLYIDNNNAKPTINLTGTNGKIAFESDININLYNAPSVTFVKGSGTVSVKGAVQVIADPTTNYVENSLSVLKGLNASGGFYYITNSTRIKDFIKTTETAGKYKVNTTRYTVTATAVDGSKVVAKNGYLVLPKPGEYDVTVVKIVEKQTYYVSTSGKSTNNGLSKSAPFKTVGDAIEAASKAGYWENDTITVKILGKTVKWGVKYTGANDGSDTKVNDRRKQQYGYDFNLVVCSDDKTNKATISIPNLSPMMGDVKFDHVNIKNIESFVCYDDNVTFTKNVTFNPDYISLGYIKKSNTVVEELELTLNNKFNGHIQLTNSLYAGKTFNEDVTVTVNNSKSTPQMVFVLYWRGQTTFKGNLNINIAKAKSVGFSSYYQPKVESTGQGEGKVIAKKAVHIIVNSKTEMDSASIANLENFAATTNLYHISNDSGISDLLEFTKSEGKFKISSDYSKYVVTAVNSKGKVTVSKNGYLTLKNPGNYSVSAQVIKENVNTCTSGHKYTDSCDAMCNVCGKTRTIKHTYKYSCSRSCKYCGIKRMKYHSIAVRIIPATEKKDGENQDICDVCHTVLASEKIEKIKKIKLSTTNYTYNGEVKTPEVIMVDTAGEELVEKVDYTLTYPKGRVNIGEYKIKVKFKGEFKGTKYLTFKINPVKTSISKLTSEKKSLKVSWKKKSSNVTGYQIQYSTSKNFKNAKTKTVNSYKTTSVTLKSLKAKKNYYLRVRTFKTVGGKKYYSAWSGYKSKKTK